MVGLSLLALVVTQTPVALTPFARVEHKPIDEMSGIVASRRYPGVFWVHNDSGDSARIFAVDRSGKVVVPSWINPANAANFAGLQVQVAANIDWEDIAYDGESLYLGDVGNNGNARKDLGVYIVREPNPRETVATRPLAWLPVSYPDQREFPPSGFKPFDCEAIFWLRGKLYFVTKHRNSAGLPLGSTALYRLDTRHTDQPNVLKRLDQRDGLGGWVTGADVSPDGSKLAVLTHFPLASVWVFDTDAPEDRFLSRGNGRQILLIGAGQCEAVCWDGNDAVVVTNEQRSMFRVGTGRPKQGLGDRGSLGVL
ncbi:MAG TPA: hypothetical protein VGE01_08885 [Fimbriimonas sp.]